MIKLQNYYIVAYPEIELYPMEIEFDFDIHNYIISDSILNKPVTIEFEFPERKNTGYTKFLESIYYSRRRNFGKSKMKVLERTSAVCTP